MNSRPRWNLESYIQGNKAGLISLARLILTLVDEGVAGGAHWHLDPPPVGGFHTGSASLIIAREDLVLGVD